MPELQCWSCLPNPARRNEKVVYPRNFIHIDLFVLKSAPENNRVSSLQDPSKVMIEKSLLTRHISRAAFFFNTPPCFIASFISTSFMTKYGFGSIRRLLHSCCSAGVSRCRSVAFSFVNVSAPFCHPFIPPLLMGFLFPNNPLLYPPLAGDGEEGMLLAGVGDEAARSAGTDVGGYLGWTSGLMGGVSTGGVALEE